MVQLSCTLDRILLWVSAIISLGLMVIPLLSGAPWSLYMEALNDPVTSKVDSILYLAISIILDVYTVSSLYFEFDVAVGLFYQTPKAKAPKIEVKGP